MRIGRLIVIGGTLLALAPSVGSAQERLFHVSLAGGPIFNAGDLGDRFANGWGPEIGFTFEAPNRRVGFQFEYAYRWFDRKNLPLLGATEFDAVHKMHQLDFNIIVNLIRPLPPRPIIITGSESPKMGIRPYLVAGPGMYHRSVEITRYVGTGIICDPYYYVCGSYDETDVVASRGGWDLGFNVGGGVAFQLDESVEFYIESRYHHVLGPDIQPITTPGGTVIGPGGSSNGSYYPLSFGFRF